MNPSNSQAPQSYNPQSPSPGLRAGQKLNTKVAQPTVRVNQNTTQNILQVSEIRDGIVIMNDGSFRSVVMVQAINFDLMSGQEKEAIEFAYQGFLNYLSFPIQIFIHSEKVDITPYLEHLNKTRQSQDNMLLSVMMEDYIYFMDQLAQQTNVMDKRFYIVVPYFPVVDMQKALTQSKNFFTGMAKLLNKKQKRVTINEDDLNRAKAELTNRVQSILDGLGQAGIQGLPLDTQELIELFYNTYNPDTAVEQQLSDFNKVNAQIIQKGQGMAKQPDLDRESLA